MSFNLLAVITLLELINQARETGQDCGSSGVFSSAAPLLASDQLDTAAQTHSTDMATTGDLSHQGSDGSGPEDRITSSGFKWAYMGENIGNAQTAEQMMRIWLDSPVHCANIMGDHFTHVGLGQTIADDQSSTVYWTIDLATAL
jgi:uncharacterized protein YkwD